MARKRSRSSSEPSSFPLLLIIVCCTAFSLGVLSPPAQPAIGALPPHAVKTEARALPDGIDLGGGAWVGLNDPSLDQTALRQDRLAKPKALAMRLARNAPEMGY